MALTIKGSAPAYSRLMGIKTSSRDKSDKVTGWRGKVTLFISKMFVSDDTDHEVDIAIDQGAPTSTHDDLAIGSLYFDETNNIWYQKVASGTNWGYLTVTMTYAGDPTNNLTPIYEGCFCYDTSNNKMYLAGSAVAAGWALITSA